MYVLTRGFLKLDNTWIPYVENQFASNIFTTIRKKSLHGMPSLQGSATLCTICRGLEIWKVDFRVELEVEQLREKRTRCDLCKLFLKTCQNGGGDGFDTVIFTRFESWLRMNTAETPALFLCRDPGKQKDPGHT